MFDRELDKDNSSDPELWDSLHPSYESSRCFKRSLITCVNNAMEKNSTIGLFIF